MSSHHDPLTDLPRMTLTYARRHFGELLDRAGAGERIVLTRNGREAFVVLSPNDPTRQALSERGRAAPTSSTEQQETDQDGIAP